MPGLPYCTAALASTDPCLLASSAASSKTVFSARKPATQHAVYVIRSWACA